jgi:hypothetical protein
MSRNILQPAHLIGLLTMTAALGVGTLPAFAQSASESFPCATIDFELANPSPGSRVEPGGFVLQGKAMDSRATQGPGIDHVQFFLDDRNRGGMSLGTAVPSTTGGPFGPNSFQTTLSLPNSIGGHELFAYAHSSVTGDESIIEVPIVLGEDPSKLSDPISTTAVESCSEAAATGGATTVTAVTAPAATAPAPAAPATNQSAAPTQAPSTEASPAVAPSVASIVFDVANPAPGDTIHVGGMTIEGVAFDRQAKVGTGVDQVQIFLGNRDDAGVLLADATPGVEPTLVDNGDDSITLVGGETSTSGASNLWHALVNLPSNQTGNHTLYFYAHSAITGAELVLTVPVTIAP